MPDCIAMILDTFSERGDERYGIEDVSQLQHALQTAELAIQEGAADSLVAAALLHDFGHLMGGHDLPSDCDSNLDDHHESRGHRFLNGVFGASVAEPVRMHVAAKRYLCTISPDYEKHLSPTSLKSYHDQGGKMSPSELVAFESETHFSEALQLRRWDDSAKDPEMKTRQLMDYKPLLDTLHSNNRKNL